MEKNMNPQAQTVHKNHIYKTNNLEPLLRIPKKPIEKPIPQKDIFQNEMSKFVYYRTYSRWDDSKKRRETWEETVERAVTFLKKASKNKLKKSD